MERHDHGMKRSDAATCTVIAAAALTVAQALAAEITVTRPTVHDRRIDRCVEGDGPVRCESAARERVAAAACRALGRGFTGALEGSVRYEGSLLPRTVAVWSDSRQRFVEGRGVDVIATLVCVGPDRPVDAP